MTGRSEISGRAFRQAELHRDEDAENGTACGNEVCGSEAGDDGHLSPNCAAQCQRAEHHRCVKSKTAAAHPIGQRDLSRYVDRSERNDPTNSGNHACRIGDEHIASDPEEHERKRRPDGRERDRPIVTEPRLYVRKGKRAGDGRGADCAEQNAVQFRAAGDLISRNEGK